MLKLYHLTLQMELNGNVTRTTVNIYEVLDLMKL